MVKIKTEIRREKILKLKKEGKTTEQIAQELRISSSTVYSDLNAMKNPTKKRVTNKEKSTKKNATNKFDINDIDVRELYGETSIPKVKLKKLEQYITNCKKKFKKGSLEKQEMKKIQEIIMLRGKYDDIIFYIGICIKFKMFAEAKFQINSHQSKKKRC